MMSSDNSKKFKKNKNKKHDSIGAKSKKSGGFQSMGFSWNLLKAIVNSGYKQPTPIQRKAIPEILSGKDVVAMARTGSGKTAAFLLPMFQRLQDNQNSIIKTTGPRALIMSPTRELAMQTFKFARLFGKYLNYKTAVILGGDKIEDQFETMHENPDIIIATPGRFLHICIEMNLKLSTIEYVVFDEADRLFEMGFKEQLDEILHKLPIEKRQTLLFSATLPQSLVEFAKAGLQNPILIRLDVESKLSDKLRLAFFQCRYEDKLPILLHLIKNIIKSVKNPTAEFNHKDNNNNRLEQTIIFVATKHHVEFLKDLLEQLGYSVSYVYSSLDQTARYINISKFQDKKSSIMVVTDVAARGIDIPMLDHVINFNFPAKAKLFVHRVGRVARAGNYGNSYSLITNDELPYMHELHEFLTKEIKFATENMDPNDWNEVYGAVPQSIVDVEKDTISNLLETKNELTSAFQVQENAYKQYLKSRPLASSTSVRAAKSIKQTHPVLYIHPLFRNGSSQAIDSEANLLEQLKRYSTKATIFEINKTAQSSKTALIMRSKREKHDTVVSKFQSSEPLEPSYFQKNMYTIQDSLFEKDKNEDEENEDQNGEIHEFDDENLVIKINNNTNTDDQENQSGSRKKNKKNRGSTIDKENFIPYKPKNYQQEKALGINSNFNREISDAKMDLIGDDENVMRKTSQKTKWDRKKKKFVSVQSTLDKSKKIKTESGNYIKASYKSDLYSKWLKNKKTFDDDDDDNDGEGNKGGRFKKNPGFGRGARWPGSKRPISTQRKDENPEKGKKRKFDDGNNQGPKHNTNKRFKVGLKNKDQIMKERQRKAKVERFQKSKQKGKKKSGSGRSSGRKSR